MPEPNWQQILQQAKTGDTQAQAQLIDTYAARVKSIVHRALQGDFRQHHRWILPLFSTQDVVQEVFSQVVGNLADCEFETEDAFIRYLGTVVQHRLVDAVRFHEAKKRDLRRKVQAPTQGMEVLPGKDLDPTPSLAASLAERAGLLRGVLAELPERHRALLEFRLMEEQGFAEIAEALGYASDETARQAFWDAQARLLVKLRAKGLGPDTCS